MFWVAFAIGAGVLWLFAQDQFNHPSWKDNDRLTRILSVPDLRGDRVRKRALFVYFLLLLVVYAIFVFFGGAVVAALDMGVGSPETMAGGAEPQPLTLPGPSVPLAVSLAIVGIAPRIEILTRIEEKIRVAAHEMMGLPRGLLSSGQALADAELSLEQIGEQNIDPVDLAKFRSYVAAAGAVFGRESMKVRLFEKRLLKLLAYRVWVVDGVWPGTAVREPYEVLEADFATDISACFDDLDAISGGDQTGRSPTEVESLRKRWDDRLKATRELCGEICALLFIYSEKQDPAASGDADPVNRSVAAFFRRVTSGNATAPELDIAIKSISGAVAVAAVWGYAGVMLRPHFGLPAGNPGVGALTASLGGLFLYGPAIAIAIWSNGRLAGGGTLRGRVSAARLLSTALSCYLLSLVFLVLLNIGQAVVAGADITSGTFRDVALAAVMIEAPTASLGALQGLFALAYLEVYADPDGVDPARRWRIIATNVVAMLLLSVAVTYLVVAAIESVGRWSNPAFTRIPVPSDFVSRVPTAGLIALIIGLVITSALASRFSGRGPRTTGQEAIA